MLNWIFNLISVLAMFSLLWSLTAIILTMICDVIIHKAKYQMDWPIVKKVIWTSSAIILIALIANGNVALLSPYS